MMTRKNDHLKNEVNAMLRMWIQEILDDLGWTAFELAKRAELPPSMLSRFLDDNSADYNTPTYVNIVKIAIASGRGMPELPRCLIQEDRVPVYPKKTVIDFLTAKSANDISSLPKKIAAKRYISVPNAVPGTIGVRLNATETAIIDPSSRVRTGTEALFLKDGNLLVQTKPRHTPAIAKVVEVIQ